MIDLNKLVKLVKKAKSVEENFSEQLWLLNIICTALTYSDIPFDQIVSEGEILNLSYEEIDNYLDFMWNLREQVRILPRKVADIEFI